MGKTLTPKQIAQRLLAVFPQLDETDRRLSLALYRGLVRGAPVPLRSVASGLDLPLDELERRLKRWPGVYFDAQGEIIGYWGLTIQRMGHPLRVGGRTLYAWCAWDTLFLPAVIGTPVEVASACHASGTPVRLTVSPDAIEAVDPAGLQVSFILPEAEDLRADVITSFCHFVHFFRSPRDAEPWLAAHPGAHLQSVQDAFEIGRIRNRAHYGAALEAQA